MIEKSESNKFIMKKLHFNILFVKVIIFLLFLQLNCKLVKICIIVKHKNSYMDFKSKLEKMKKRSIPLDLSFFKTEYEDTHIKYYRLALLYIGICFPLTAFIYKFLSIHFIDPFWLRVIISFLFLSVCITSFKIKFIYHNIVALFNFCLFTIFLWSLYIASINDFSLVTSITFIIVVSINCAAIKKTRYILFYIVFSTIIMVLFFIRFKIDFELGFTILLLTMTIQFVVYLIIKSKNEAELLLIDSEMKMRYLIDALGEGIGIINEKNIILYANPSAHQIFEIQANQLFQSPISSFLIEESIKSFIQRPKLDKNFNSQTFELLIQTKNNECKTLLVTESLYNMEYHDFYGTIMVFRDISDRKIKEIELKEAKKKAEESERLKSSFLANMSHEIRTPMNGIIGFTDLMSQTELTYEEQKHYSSIIHQCCHKLLNVINDIIDVSKIEAGMVEVRKDAMDVNDQLQLIYQFFKPEVEAKGMELIIKYGLKDHESSIITDADKFYSILTNLVKNSIKYSHQGYIEFGYHVINENSNIKELQFYVTDTGIGIPIDRQESIFERFIQVDLDNRRSYQGSGLGLSIAKSYVEMLGGTIGVESVEGIGSTFYFTIPYHTVQN
ncbi:MAG: domain S-box protein [Bacteroidetes bacterium]|nr:domain S-box protein [Bacteroidota bacterium]